jgi:hypothetical protein
LISTIKKGIDKNGVYHLYRFECGPNMKEAVSISLGSSTRDKRVQMDLLGQPVSIRREGTDGDESKAASRFAELDGKVDAFGLGGINLAIQVEQKSYPLRSAQKLICDVDHTPVVDGSGLKTTLENQVVDVLINELGPDYRNGRVLLTVAIERPGMMKAFFDHGYDVTCGDLMFGLGLPLAVHSYKHLIQLAKIIMPITSRLPISMLYPTGEKQEQIVSRFGRWYDWADVIAGDCGYIKRHMPDDLSGKVIVTNTTTETDMMMFRERGVGVVVTTTPVIEGRSFGTNMLEAALVASYGKGRLLKRDELSAVMARLALKPKVHRL